MHNNVSYSVTRNFLKIDEIFFSFICNDGFFSNRQKGEYADTLAIFEYVSDFLMGFVEYYFDSFMAALHHFSKRLCLGLSHVFSGYLNVRGNSQRLATKTYGTTPTYFFTSFSLMFVIVCQGNQ